jgi:hypothetical protein
VVRLSHRCTHPTRRAHPPPHSLRAPALPTPTIACRSRCVAADPNGHTHLPPRAVCTAFCGFLQPCGADGGGARRHRRGTRIARSTGVHPSRRPLYNHTLCLASLMRSGLRSAALPCMCTLRVLFRPQIEPISCVFGIPPWPAVGGCGRGYLRQYRGVHTFYLSHFLLIYPVFLIVRNVAATHTYIYQPPYALPQQIITSRRYSVRTAAGARRSPPHLGCHSSERCPWTRP